MLSKEQNKEANSLFIKKFGSCILQTKAHLENSMAVSGNLFPYWIPKLQ